MKKWLLLEHLKIKKLFWLIIILSSILLIIFSLYSIDTNSWVWQLKISFQKIMGTLSGLVVFTGILARYYFFKNKNYSFYYVLTYNILYGFFALSFNATSAFIVNIFLFNIIYLIFFFAKKWQWKIADKNLEYDLMIALMLFVTIFIFTWFTIENFNFQIGNFLGIANFEYLHFFKFKFTSKILAIVINGLSIAFVYLMVKNYRSINVIWPLKNLISIVFFAGIAIININAIVINVIYMLFSVYQTSIFLKDKIHISIIGPGAVGKTTTIKHLKKKWLIKLFKFVDGKLIINETNNYSWIVYKNYLKDMKSTAFETQRISFKARIDKMQNIKSKRFALMDRHLLDDFIYPKVHIELKNFTEAQKNDWLKYECKYLQFLKQNKKLDLVVLLTNDWKTISNRRVKRSINNKNRTFETNSTNLIFFKKTLAYYNEDYDKFLKNIIKHNAKKLLYLKNENSETSAKIIYKAIKKMLINYL